MLEMIFRHFLSYQFSCEIDEKSEDNLPIDKANLHMLASSRFTAML